MLQNPSSNIVVIYIKTCGCICYTVLKNSCIPIILPLPEPFINLFITFK